ncbi:MAG: glycosyltransferase [Pseudonocardia sp.]|nr:glycosyltransferase [Pseudonocardia sp.]
MENGSGHRWLAIAEEVFVPADAGGRVESLNLLRAARAAGLLGRVLVPGIGDPGIGDTALAAHRAALPGVDLVGTPRRTGWRSHLSRTPYLFASRPLPAGLTDSVRGRGFTAVLAVSFRVAHLAVELAEALDIPAIVRPHNVESAYFAQLARSSRFPRDLPYAAEAWKLRRAEAAVHASPRIAVFAEIAEEEVAVRAALTDIPVIHVPPFLPPQPDTARVHRTEPGGTVLFLGALDNANNSGGIGWFVEDCWPGLRAPGVSLHVVGRRAPAPLVDDLRAAGAEVTVDAPEVASHLAAADVFVNPVRHGAGISIKMIEAMAAGLPVVSTPVGARGLPWRDGEHLLVADGPAAVRAAGQGRRDAPARRAELADTGRRFITGELDGVRQIGRLVEALATARR